MPMPNCQLLEAPGQSIEVTTIQEDEQAKLKREDSQDPIIMVPSSYPTVPKVRQW